VASAETVLREEAMAEWGLNASPSPSLGEALAEVARLRRRAARDEAMRPLVARLRRQLEGLQARLAAEEEAGAALAAAERERALRAEAALEAALEEAGRLRVRAAEAVELEGRLSGMVPRGGLEAAEAEAGRLRAEAGWLRERAEESVSRETLATCQARLMASQREAAAAEARMAGMVPRCDAAAFFSQLAVCRTQVPRRF
jgi:hypothetical protein